MTLGFVHKNKYLQAFSSHLKINSTTLLTAALCTKPSSQEYECINAFHAIAAEKHWFHLRIKQKLVLT